MTTNWVKDCGVDIGKCEMCLLLDVANDRLTKEVADGAALADELARERAGYRREAEKYRQWFRLTVCVLVIVFVMVLAGWVR